MISCCFKNDMKTNFTLGSESSTWYVIKNCKIKHEACCYHHMMNLTSFLGSSRANLWRKAQVRLVQQLCTKRFKYLPYTFYVPVPICFIICVSIFSEDFTPATLKKARFQSLRFDCFVFCITQKARIGIYHITQWLWVDGRVHCVLLCIDTLQSQYSGENFEN